ncbi:SDR family NAD(P)-dependent oxidoreductase [Schlesneria sp. T3-172]|uniref:SDR family NAD(P)-dependent oxidoreductase n=1 Tax=Schlesneria sphaerica TaxID=3373610 RepID=UPI0037C934CE
MPRDRGVIVNTVSVVSTRSPPVMAVYNATKSAVDYLTTTFAKEPAPRSSRVNLVKIGFIAKGVVFLASDDLIKMIGPMLSLTVSAGEHFL